MSSTSSSASSPPSSLPPAVKPPPPPSLSSSSSSSSSAFTDSAFLSAVQSKLSRDDQQRLGIGFRSGPFQTRHLVPLKQDVLRAREERDRLSRQQDGDSRGSAAAAAAAAAAAKLRTQQHEQEEEEEGEDEGGAWLLREAGRRRRPQLAPPQPPPPTAQLGLGAGPGMLAAPFAMVAGGSGEGSGADTMKQAEALSGQPVQPPALLAPEADEPGAAVDAAAAAAAPLLSSSASASCSSSPSSCPAAPSGLGQQVVQLIVQAVRLQGEMLQQYAAHVLLQQDAGGEKEEKAGEGGGRLTLDDFAARFRLQLQRSYDELRRIQALLAQERQRTSSSTATTGEQQRQQQDGDGQQGRPALDSLFSSPILGPLSTTLSSLLPSASSSPLSAFAALSSSLSSLTASTAAAPSSAAASTSACRPSSASSPRCPPSSPPCSSSSVLSAKRGRGRLRKCEKHRRWKKRCPADCPDKPVNQRQGARQTAGAAEAAEQAEPDSGDAEDDEEEAELETEARGSRAAGDGLKRRWTEEGEAAALRRRQQEGTAAVRAAAASASSPSAFSVSSLAAEAIRAYEPTAASVLPSALSRAMTAQQQRPQSASGSASQSASLASSALVVTRPHPLSLSQAAASHPMPLSSSLPPATATTTIYTAQPIVLPSHALHHSSSLFAYSPAAAFPAAAAAFSSPSMLSLKQLTAMAQQQQQQLMPSPPSTCSLSSSSSSPSQAATHFHLVQPQQPQLPPAFSAHTQPIRAAHSSGGSAALSLVYASRGAGAARPPFAAFTAAGQAYHMH